MYAAMNEKENAQCFGVVRRKPSRGRPAAALWPLFFNFSPKIMRPVLSHLLAQNGLKMAIYESQVFRIFSFKIKKNGNKKKCFCVM